MQMALDALEPAVRPIEEAAVKALRGRLAQPEYEFECPRCGHCCQQREWVGLTDDEYEQFSKWTHIEIIERIVAKLKEKND